MGCRVFAIHGSRIVSPRLCVPSLTSWFLQGAKTFSYIFYPHFFFFPFLGSAVYEELHLLLLDIFFYLVSAMRKDLLLLLLYLHLFSFGFCSAQRPPSSSSSSSSSSSTSFLVWFLQSKETSYSFFIYIFSQFVSAVYEDLLLLLHLHLHLFLFGFCKAQRPPSSSLSTSLSN